MTEEALEELLQRTYPKGDILSLEKGKKVALADVRLEDGIAIVEINLENGELKEVKKLPSPEEALNNAKKVIEENFPLKSLEIKGRRVIEHKFLELDLEGEGGRAVVKIDGATRDILDYAVEITPENAVELVKEKCSNLNIKDVKENDASYVIDGESDRHVVRIKVTKDGRIIKERERVLREELTSFPPLRARLSKE